MKNRFDYVDFTRRARRRLNAVSLTNNWTIKQKPGKLLCNKVDFCVFRHWISHRMNVYNLKSIVAYEKRFLAYTATQFCLNFGEYIFIYLYFFFSWHIMLYNNNNNIIKYKPLLIVHEICYDYNKCNIILLYAQSPCRVYLPIPTYVFNRPIIILLLLCANVFDNTNMKYYIAYLTT